MFFPVILLRAEFLPVILLCSAKAATLLELIASDSCRGRSESVCLRSEIKCGKV